MCKMTSKSLSSPVVTLHSPPFSPQTWQSYPRTAHPCIHLLPFCCVFFLSYKHTHWLSLSSVIFIKDRAAWWWCSLLLLPCGLYSLPTPFSLQSHISTLNKTFFFSFLCPHLVSPPKFICYSFTHLSAQRRAHTHGECLQWQCCVTLVHK